MVKISNGKNTLVVPTKAYDEYYAKSGWELLAVKKTDSIIKVAENTEKVENLNNNKKNKRK